MGGLRFGVDGDGNYGYYGDDDVLVPFKSGFTTLSVLFQHLYTESQNKTYTATKDCVVLAMCSETTQGGDGSAGYKSTLTSTGEILSINNYRKESWIGNGYRAVDMHVALIKISTGDTINMTTAACAKASTIMQVFELS